MFKGTFRRRPRRSVFAFVVAATVASLLFATVALALISDSGTHTVVVADSGSSLTADLGNATVEYIGSDSDKSSSGTGLFDPFLRIQGSPTEEGYNTCSQQSCGGDVTEFDTKTGSWTKAILASAIPVVDCGGDLAGTDCWELFVDINEGNNAKYVSLNEVEVWLTTNANITDYNTDTETGFTGQTGTEQAYDFSGEIQIHDVNEGSGRGDLRYLIPVQEFESGDYFVLYSEWGTTTGAAPDGKTWGSEGGFEEWKVRKAPNINIVKTANPVGPVNAGATIGFDITVTNTGAAAATNLTITDNLPAGAALNWTLNPSFSGCSITGSVGSQVLTCTFATLAAGGTIGPIHVQSATTAADCGVVPNTAMLTFDGGSDSSSASVTVQCAAIRILKQSTKTNFPLVTDAGNGALFTVTPPAGAAFTVRDNNDPSAGGKSDESTTFGEVCISGLAPGSYTVVETTPPSGYGAGTTVQGTAVAVIGTSCTAPNKPTDANSAIFRNPPLFDIQVRFRDGGSGETSLVSAIACAGADGTSNTDDTTGWGLNPPPNGDTLTITGNKVSPGPTETITCTIVVDP